MGCNFVVDTLRFAFLCAAQRSKVCPDLVTADPLAQTIMKQATSKCCALDWDEVLRMGMRCLIQG